MTKIIRRLIQAFFCGGVIVAFACLLRFERGEEFKHFCDAFSLAGVALLTVAGCGYLKNQGAFLGIGYALQRVKGYLLPSLEKKESYADYRERKTEQDDADTPLPFLTAGLFYLAIACALLIFY